MKSLSKTSITQSIARLRKAGVVQDDTVQVMLNKKGQQLAKESAGEIAFAHALQRYGTDLLPYVRELTFALPRRFRADFAWPESMLLVEIDGGSFAPQGGRHAGDKDKEKGNIAAAKGWRVMHFSPRMVDEDPLACIELVRQAVLYRTERSGEV